MKYMLFILLFTGRCVDERNPKNLIKFNNLSSKQILIYYKENYPDTIINKDDEGMISAGLHSTIHFSYAPTIMPNHIEYIGDEEYCHKGIWANHIKKDTLILFIFDKNKLVETKSIKSSKLKTLFLTYDYLVANNCTITYQE